ncbi:Nucleoplasmin-like domain-containing protein [Entamoeba marina]
MSAQVNFSIVASHNADIAFLQDDEFDKPQPILIGKVNSKTCPTHTLNLFFDIAYIDFLIKGEGEIHFTGRFDLDHKLIDYDGMDIIEEGFDM